MLILFSSRLHEAESFGNKLNHPIHDLKDRVKKHHHQKEQENDVQVQMKKVLLNPLRQKTSSSILRNRRFESTIMFLAFDHGYITMIIIRIPNLNIYLLREILSAPSFLSRP